MRRMLLVLVVVWSSYGSLLAHTPTWTDGIACIMYTYCTKCHNPNGIAPFSLVDYQDVFVNRFSIAASVQAGSMPPFPPDKSKQSYAHAHTLTQHEIDELVYWAYNNGPFGNAADAPTPPVYDNNYDMVDADTVLKIPNYPVNTGSDLYRVFVLPLNNPTNRSVVSLEFVPSNPALVHHALVYHDTASRVLQLDAADPLPGYTNFGGTGSNTSQLMWGWVPGQRMFSFPQGFGSVIQANSNILIQVHYPPGIVNDVDSSMLRIKYGPSNVRRVNTLPALNHFNTLKNGPLFIPANEVKTFYSEMTVPIAQTVTAVAPHMHLIGESIKAYVVSPQGDTTILVDIPRWSFHWQGLYQFQRPIIVAAGSKVYGEATYNNTSSNLYNPSNPPKDVRVGEATTDEMMLVYFNISNYQAGDEQIIIDTTGTPYHEACFVQPTGIQQRLEQLVEVYPNPAGNWLRIDGVPGLYAVKLYDPAGRLLLSQDNCHLDTTLPTAGLPRGPVFLQIHTERGGLLFRKVVLE